MADGRSRLTPKEQIANREFNRRFDRIYEEMALYIGAVCRGFSRKFYAIGAEDLRQESAIKLLHLLRTRQDLTDAQLMNVFKVSMYNLLRDIYRSYMRSSSMLDRTVDPDFVPGAESEESVTSDFLFREYVDQVKRKLSSELDRRILDLILEPDSEVVSMAHRRQRLKELAKAQGAFVMNAEEVWITEEILARRSGVSPATTSRALKRIRRQLLAVIRVPL